LKLICATQATRAKYVTAQIERGRNPEYARAAAKWDLDIECEQAELSTKPVHDTADPAKTATHTAQLRDVQWGPHGKTVLTASADKAVRLWDVSTGKTIRAFNIPVGAGYLNQARFIDNGRAIVVVAEKQPIRIIDIASGNTVAEVPYKPGQPRATPKIATTNDLVVLGDRSGDLVVFDVKTNAEKFRLPGVNDEQPVFSVADSAGLLVAAWYLDREEATRLLLLKLRTGEPLWDLKINGRIGSSIALSRDGKHVALPLDRIPPQRDGNDNKVHVYATAEKKLLSSFVVHPYFNAGRLTFTADGKGLIAGTTHAILWDIETGKRQHHFGPFSDNWSAADVSPDGKYLVTANDGSDVRIWEIATGAFHRRLGRNMPAQ
jgi:WD40 repeat protein